MPCSLSRHYFARRPLRLQLKWRLTRWSNRPSQDVLEIIKKDKDIQAGNKQKIYALVDAKVLPHFDFKRMTQLAVGKSWRQATPAQQDALVKEFRTLLVRTYSTSLSTYKNKTIDYKPLRMQSGDTDVTVKTSVNQPGASLFHRL